MAWFYCLPVARATTPRGCSLEDFYHLVSSTEDAFKNKSSYIYIYIYIHRTTYICWPDCDTSNSLFSLLRSKRLQTFQSKLPNSCISSAFLQCLQAHFNKELNTVGLLRQIYCCNAIVHHLIDIKVTYFLHIPYCMFFSYEKPAPLWSLRAHYGPPVKSFAHSCDSCCRKMAYRRL